MAHRNTKRRERVLDLGGGLAIWRVHLDALREQDVNARVMSPEKFERLVENVRKEKHLESLPLCCFQQNRAGNEELAIISGHHRTRSARAAGLEEIFVLVIERELNRDEIRAKQLAHNALEGDDDRETLARMYAEIESIDARIETGLTDAELQAELPTVAVDDVRLEFDHELLYVLFLPLEYEGFLEVLDRLEQDSTVLIADKADFEHFAETARTVSKRENVRNVAAILTRMTEIVNEHYAAGD